MRGWVDAVEVVDAVDAVDAADALRQAPWSPVRQSGLERYNDFIAFDFHDLVPDRP
jgi:hypothetical protein